MSVVGQGVVGEMRKCGVAALAASRLHAGAGQRLFAMVGAGKPAVGR